MELFRICPKANLDQSINEHKEMEICLAIEEYEHTTSRHELNVSQHFVL